MKDLLAKRIQIGDEQAFELLFRKHYVSLCSFANKFLEEPEDAKDVVQEVFTKLWQHRIEIDPKRSLSSYLLKITQNDCINKLKRKKVELKYIEIYKLIYVDNNDFSPCLYYQANELNNNIIRALDKLPLNCRRVFELNRFEGLKYKEIATVLQISIKTVESQMSKALKKLRLELLECS